MVHGSPLSMDPMVQRWIKRAGALQGIPCMITLGWCLELVLVAFTKAPFELLATCSLKHLSWKTMFLLAIASAHRALEMHTQSCDIPYLGFSNVGVTLLTKLSFLQKVATSENAARPFLCQLCTIMRIGHFTGCVSNVL